MLKSELEDILSLNVVEGKEGPFDLLDKEVRLLIKDKTVLLDTNDAVKAKSSRYVPSDPGRPWSDFQVQNCARRFLKEVVLPDWVENHPHKKCSNIRVDEWGRVLCRYITPTQINVDGPWENPTHFLMYAYNTFKTQQKYGIRLNTYMKEFCNIVIS